MFEIVVISFVVFALFYWCRQRFRQLPLPHYEGRHVIITGCDTGFGNMLAKELDNRGFSVFAGCFTSNGEEELKKSCSHKLQCFPLDVSNTNSIQRALLFIKSKLPRDTGIWCLVNNAGIGGSVGPSDWLTRRDFEEVMSVNLYGMIDMTNAFLPLIRKEKGRIVNMTSICGRITLAPVPYCASKFAAEAYSDYLRRDLYKEGVSVHIIEPGYFATNIADPGKASNLLRAAYDKCDPGVKEYYGSAYVEQTIEKSKKFLSMVTNNNPGLVVDAYLSAVCSRYPAHRYLVGMSAQIVFRILWNLPESISDFILCLGRPVPVNLKPS